MMILSTFRVSGDDLINAFVQALRVSDDLIKVVELPLVKNPAWQIIGNYPINTFVQALGFRVSDENDLVKPLFRLLVSDDSDLTSFVQALLVTDDNDLINIFVWALGE